jgi:hypothetical protein
MNTRVAREGVDLTGIVIKKLKCIRVGGVARKGT